MQAVPDGKTQRLDSFVNNLEAHRVSSGMTHGEFADWLGVNRATWSLIRRGINRYGQPRSEETGRAFVGRVLMNHPEFSSIFDTIAA